MNRCELSGKDKWLMALLVEPWVFPGAGFQRVEETISCVLQEFPPGEKQWLLNTLREQHTH